MLEILKEGRLVNEGRVGSHAWIAVENGIILAVGEGNPDDGLLSRADAVTDLRGDYLLPGVIDEHVHLREPGMTHKGDIASETAVKAILEQIRKRKIKTPTKALEEAINQH